MATGFLGSRQQKIETYEFMDVPFVFVSPLSLSSGGFPGIKEVMAHRKDRKFPEGPMSHSKMEEKE
jgi:hypothetical protein